VSVYSTLFFHGTVPAGVPTLYTVPAAMTVVLRDLELYNGDAVERNTNFQLQVAGSQAIFWAPQVQPATWYQWHGRTVIPSGGIVIGYGGGSTLIQLTMSGYLLSP
jgi:hypothetical protein